MKRVEEERGQKGADGGSECVGRKRLSFSAQFRVSCEKMPPNAPPKKPGLDLTFLC